MHCHELQSFNPRHCPLSIDVTDHSRCAIHVITRLSDYVDPIRTCVSLVRTGSPSLTVQLTGSCSARISQVLFLPSIKKLDKSVTGSVRRQAVLRVHIRVRHHSAHLSSQRHAQLACCVGLRAPCARTIRTAQAASGPRRFVMTGQHAKRCITPCYIPGCSGAAQRSSGLQRIWLAGAAAYRHGADCSVSSTLGWRQTLRRCAGLHLSEHMHTNMTDNRDP
jgi:hypothetical protein